METVQQQRRIESLRKELQRLRQPFDEAVNRLTNEEMVEILSDVCATAFSYRQDSPPHIACFFLGQIQEKLARWYNMHHTIRDYHNKRQQLANIEIEAMNNGRG